VWSAGKLRAALAEPQGRIVRASEIRLDEHPQAGEIVDPVAERIDALIGEAGLERSSLTGVVLGVPAPFQPGVGRPHGRPAPSDAAVPGGYAPWLDRDPAPEIAERLGVPALSENDANLGALGEGAFGAARGLDSHVYVKIGSRSVGAGMVFAGRLHRGAAGFAGELAHIQVRDDGPLCHCGGRGCLIGLLDATLLEIPQPSYEQPPPLHQLLRLAEQGGTGPRRILVDLGRTIGRPLADLCTFLNPAAVVLDGSLGPAGEHVTEGVRQAVERHSAPVAAATTRVLCGGLGDRADLLGAVILARDESLAGVAV
jgi:predicted NBD/HSP70 family sugar kinase